MESTKARMETIPKKVMILIAVSFRLTFYQQERLAGVTVPKA